MKKRVCFAGLLLSILSSNLAAAQETQTVFSPITLMGFVKKLGDWVVSVIVWLWQQILPAAAFMLGLQASQTYETVFSLIVGIFFVVMFAKTLKDFTAFSSKVSWIIAIGLTIILIVTQIIRILGTALFGFVSIFIAYPLLSILIGTVIIVLIYMLLRMIGSEASESIKKQKQKEKRIKEAAGRKVLEKVGEEAKKE